jgi:hypothetical protein
VLEMRFDMAGDPQTEQRGFPTSISIDSFRKIEEGEYVVEGTIAKCATGIYHMDTVNIQLPGYSIWKGYRLGADFKDILEVKVDNHDGVHFPKIDDVYAEQPKEEKAAAEGVRK